MILFKYSGNVFRKEDLDNVNVVSDALVTIRKISDNSIAVIYEDESGLIPKSNPFSNSATSKIEFFTQFEQNGYRIQAETQTDTTPLVGYADEIIGLDPNLLNFKYVYIESYGGGPNASGFENAAALSAAIADSNVEKTVFIGGTGSLYNFDSLEVASPSINIECAKGVTIKTTKNSADVLWLFNTQSATIKGGFTIDCDNYNAVGIRVFNDQVSGGVNLFEDFTATNALQQTAIVPTVQANGLTVWGAFQKSSFNRVRVINVKSDGPATRINGAIARGIVCRYHNIGETVLDWTLQTSKKNYFNDCYIENISPASEGDGIFCQENPFFYGQENLLSVVNCTFKNCLKRSVKSQFSNSYIAGNLTIRTLPSDLIDEAGAFGVDYDMQYSNATVIGNTSEYHGGDQAPQTMVVFSAHQTLEYNGVISEDNLPPMSGYIAGNKCRIIGSGNPKTDFTGKGFRFLGLQNRANGNGTLINLDEIGLSNNSASLQCDSFIDGFIFKSPLTSIRQVQNLNLNGNYVKELTSISIVNFRNAGGAGFYNSRVNIDGFETLAETIVNAYLSDDPADDETSVNYIARDNGHVLGALSSKVTGKALNTNTVSLDILIPVNTQYHIKCEYSRRSNTQTQVRSFLDLIAHDSALGGLRGENVVSSLIDRQAGIWKLSGSVGNSWAGKTGYNTVRLTKEAGVTSDGFGAFAGDYVVQVECAQPCLVVPSFQSPGANSPSYSMQFLVETVSGFSVIPNAKHAMNSAAVTSCTIPSLNDGDEFWIYDKDARFDNFNFTVTYNGSTTIDGLAANYVMDIQGTLQKFIYNATLDNLQPVRQ